jgi:prepilin-type N-terminal cleavage/methylation domain-containing protein
MQEEKIKGFTIFEVMIVMVLIGIVSGLAYPSFSQWRKDAAIKGAAIKIRGLFLNTTAQVQRGLYGFAQVYVNTAPTEIEGDEEVAVKGIGFVSRGMKQTSISTQRSLKASIWNDPADRCLMESGGTEGAFWDDDGQVSDKPEVSAFILEDIALNITVNSAVCFSKDGSLYGTNGSFINGNDFFGPSVWAMYICEDKSNKDEEDYAPCTDGENIREGIKYLYALSWSRFGNVTLYRYNSTDEEFIAQ